MTEFLDDDQLSDKSQLIRAVSFLELVVSTALQGQHINPVLLPFLLAAWREILNNKGLDRTRNAIEAADEARLRDHGLVGANLALKRKALSVWYNQFLLKPDGTRLRKVVGGLRSLFSSLFDAAGAGPFLKEFLDMLAGSIQEHGEEIADA